LPLASSLARSAFKASTWALTTSHKVGGASTFIPFHPARSLRMRGRGDHTYATISPPGRMPPAANNSPCSGIASSLEKGFHFFFMKQEGYFPSGHYILKREKKKE